MTYPTTGGRYLGEPALHVKYADGYHNTELVYANHQVRANGNVVTTEITLKDPVTSLEVKLCYDAYQKENVICAHTEIKNAGKKPAQLLNYASGALNLDADQYYLTHFHGGWADEMQMDGELLKHDTKVIESRRGTQVTQCSNPSFLVSLDADRLQENVGDVVAGALAWSGNFRLSFEQDESGRLTVLAGISPFASTYELAAGKTFTTPDFIYTFSCKGAGQASRNLHAWARNYGVYGGGQINPTLLNSWEGAYFTFTTETLLRMIDDAAAMGLEMFVQRGRRRPRRLGSEHRQDSGRHRLCGLLRPSEGPQVRHLDRAGDGQSPEQPGAQASRVGGPEPRPRDLPEPEPMGAGPEQSGGPGLRVRHLRQHDAAGAEHRLHQVGLQPDGRRFRQHVSGQRAGPVLRGIRAGHL